MMNKMNLLLLGFVSTISLWCCSPQKSNDPKVSTSLSVEQALIEKAIDAHGGQDKWDQLTELNYTKKIWLYKSEDELEKELIQEHHYTYQPSFIGEYTYTDTIQHKIVYQNNEAYRIDGNKKNAPDPKSRNNFNSAFYVLNMPWKLNDPGTVTKHEGKTTLFDGKEVESLRVHYPEGERDDTWWYYFEPESGKIVATMVYHAPTYALITNDEQIEHQGLLWNAKRTTYRVDSLGAPVFVRGRYEYYYGE